jgi:hypothetical protein
MPQKPEKRGIPRKRLPKPSPNYRQNVSNKVKAMLRQHYGLRDERFFILRLLGLHEAKFRLSGC